MKVVVLEDVITDIRLGIRFYESSQEGLGEQFHDAMLADLNTLSRYAGTHAKRFGFYRALSKRFPYATYYLIEEDTAFVYAILGLRRDPRRLENILSDRQAD